MPEHIESLLRKPLEDDWPAILEVAHQAAPWAGEHNQEWLDNRRRFDERGLARRHYVAVEPTANEVIGYGAIEEGPQSRSFRIFVVMNPDLLNGPLGDQLYERLKDDLQMLDADHVWAREEAVDRELLDFLSARGFEEIERYVLPDGREVVELESQAAT